MLEKLSLRYDPVDDRISLCVQVRADDQSTQWHWLHLTRRVCAAWRPHLQAMVDSWHHWPFIREVPAERRLIARPLHAFALQCGHRDIAQELERDGHLASADSAIEAEERRRAGSKSEHSPERKKTKRA